mgnify:CR=1 FL=1
MKNKLIYGILYTLSIVAGFILFFAERRYKKNSKKQAKE